MRGSWRLNKDFNILTSPTPPDIAVCRSRSPDAQPEARGLSFLLSVGFLYHILSPTYPQNLLGGSNSSIWPIHRNLSSATTPGQSGPGSDDNERILCFTQSSSITGASLLDCLVSYQDTRWGSLTLLQWCSQCILQPQTNGPVECGIPFITNNV